MSRTLGHRTIVHKWPKTHRKLSWRRFRAKSKRELHHGRDQFGRDRPRSFGYYT